MFQVPASAWQPSLPVSPWSTQERGAGFGPSMDTETVLRTDLKALRRSRFKGWFYFTLMLCVAGFVGYLGIITRVELKKISQQYNKLKTDHSNAEQTYRQTLASLGVSESAAAAAAARAPGKAAPAAKGAAAPTAAVAPAGPPSARGAKLAEDLKKRLAGIPGLTVEARGDRVVIGLETHEIFTGNSFEVDLAGYRILNRFGKVLRTVKDRNVVVSVPSTISRRGKSWNVASLRAVSLGKFLVDDISVDPHRVSSRAPAPLPRGARADRIEFSLESAPETTKS
jgi:flagellar motor protein MotB